MRILATSPFIDSLEHIIGFLLVMAALGFLWTLTAIVGRLFVRMGFVAAAPRTTPSTELQKSDDVNEEEVAAIAACIVAILGRRSRIVSIRPGRSTDWNREGRREHFSSRRIR